MQVGIIPLKLEIKADYYFAMTILPEAQWKQLLRDLINVHVDWVNTGPLSLGQIGITDSTHKVISVPQINSTPISYQYVLKQNTNAKLFKLGFTINEVLSLLNT